MNDQNTANDWAEPGESTPTTDAVAETPEAAPTKNKKKWSTAAVAGIAAACLASGAIGFGIGNYTSHHDGPRQFSEAPDVHFGPEGQHGPDGRRGPGGHGGPDGQFGPNGQMPPRPGDADLNNNGIEDHREPGFDDDALAPLPSPTETSPTA